MVLHLIKLCVGVESVDEMAAYVDRRRAQCRARGQTEEYTHVTRMRPKRAAQLCRGGSLYWVIRGVIQARQDIIDLRDVITNEGVRKCAIVLAPRLVRTEPRAHRPFQGWRYLEAVQAPADLETADDDTLPPRLVRDLANLGVR